MKILLSGSSGYIGKNLLEALSTDAEVFALSKYPTTEQTIKGDIFKLDDVVRAMNGCDLAIYFLDPTKRSSKKAESSFRNMNALAADNFGRAAELNGIKGLVYISGTETDFETVTILRSYNVPVYVTKEEVKRKGILPSIQMSKRDDVRLIYRYQVPESWTVEHFINHFLQFLSDAIPKVTKIEEQDGVYTLKARSKNLLKFKRHSFVENERYIFNLLSGALMYEHRAHNGNVEFRRLPNSNDILVAIHQFEPASWWLYLVLQSPLQQLTLSILDVDMRIERFNEEIANGKEKEYTKKNK